MTKLHNFSRVKLFSGEQNFIKAFQMFEKYLSEAEWSVEGIAKVEFQSLRQIKEYF